MAGKRESVPPVRINYSAPGQQRFTQIPGPSRTEPFSLYNGKSLEELHDLFTQNQQIVTQCEDILKRTTPIALKYENVDESAMSPEEVELWRCTKTEHNNAKVCAKQASERMRDITTVIGRRMTPTGDSQLRTGKQVSSRVIEPARNPTSKASSDESKSTSTTITSKIKATQINAEKDIMSVRHQAEEAIEILEDKIELLKKAQPDSEEEASKVQAEITQLEEEILKLKRRTESKVKRMEEVAKIRTMELEVELEEEQQMPRDEDLGVESKTRQWIETQQQIGNADLPPQVPQEFQHYQFAGNEQQSHPQRTPGWQQWPTRQQGVRPMLAPVNKDDLMVQLLQTQLNILQRPTWKDWEPKDLPTFSGKAEDWPIFKNELVRTTPDGRMNSSQNAIRLRKALTGTAKETVIGLLNDPNNVQKIIDMLGRRFGRNELVIDALIQKAENCKAPDINKPDTFVQFGITVQQLVESLRSLNEKTYLNDRTLQNKLVSKLPVLYASEWLSWIDARPDLINNLDSFGKWMERKVDNLMRLSKPTIKEEDTSKRSKRGSGVVTTATTDADRSEKRCEFCGKSNHTIHKCFSFKKQSVDSRIKVVKEKGLCFRCLDKGHSKRDCSSEQTCTFKDCGSSHHPLIHEEKSWKGKKKSKAKSNGSTKGSDGEDEVAPEGSAAKKEENVDSTIGGKFGKSSKTISICRARVKGPKGTRKVYALLDSGADSTIIDDKLASELGLAGKTFEHVCSGVGGIKIAEPARAVSFEISGTYPKAEYFKVGEATTMKSLGIPPHTQDAEAVKRKYPYLKRAKLESYSNATPLLIIGEDYPHLTAHRNIMERGDHEPMAKRTVLGWVLAGKLSKGRGMSTLNYMTDCGNQALEKLIKESYSLESFGLFPTKNGGSIEDQRALQLLERTVKKIGDAWECGLLWRNENVKFPESRQEAVKRLLSNERRMKKDVVLLHMYHNKIEEYLRKGYITEMSAEEAAVRRDKTFYVPHFPHFNVNKPGKFRLVYDAAAKVAGESFNDKLVTGPDLIRPLAAVLWNFRRHNIVIQGDIEEFFHRVMVCPEDRDSQRFVFRNLKKQGDPIRDYWINVLFFGSCSSPASAIYVKNINAKQSELEFPEAVRVIQDDFYCDDCLTGAQTVQEASVLRQQICDINKSGNFFVKKWLSNSVEVIQSVPEEDRAVGVKQMNGKSEIPTERILGMWWDPAEDCFTFSTNFKKIRPELLDGERPTKRELCSVLMSVFDPLGFIGNLKIKGMILLQRSWKSGIDWDDHVTDEILEDWKIWLVNLKNTDKLRIPRCYCLDIHLATSVQLHSMVDASEEACAAISFLRIECGEQISVSFVSAKVKVAPVKKLTIPRLELLAAVMGASLADTITMELRVPLSCRVFWSDSKTVLLWIRTETLRYKEFVANKISRIHELTNVSEWRWVPTELNVADNATRLQQEINLSSDSVWLTGPEFLRLRCEDWPEEKKTTVAEEDTTEVKKSHISALGSSKMEMGLLKMERFSSLNRLIRAQATVNKVIRHWVSKVRASEASGAAPWAWDAELPKQDGRESEKDYTARVASFLRKNVKTNLLPADLEKAEEDLIRQVQVESFSGEYTALEKGELGKLQKLRKLSPFLRNGIIRMAGRIGEADASPGMKQPIILPGRHHFTELLIAREHERNAHQGQSTVLNNLRQKYWIIEGKASVRRYCSNCPVCRLQKVKPVVPTMGDLPSYRLAHGQPPFTFTGMDLFGPIEVTVGRHHEKRWVYLFTCMVTRGIHLEIVYGLSTDETMLALSRFVDQRGRPKFVYSDNGTNFVGAKRYLRESWEDIDWSSIATVGGFQEIQWKFSPPCSPHFGGAWERMVQSVKKVLKNVVNEKFPKDQTLLTVVKGAENIVNSRPLSSLSDDPADPSPLTPNHFLRGFCDMGPSIPGKFGEDDNIARMQWRRAQRYLELFWERWTREVLPVMAKRQKWYTDTRPLGVGDLVFLVDDQVPRNTWQRGFISTIFPGKDGQVRVVEVTTQDMKNNKKVTYRRGVDKVCPIGLTMGKSD